MLQATYNRFIKFAIPALVTFNLSYLVTVSFGTINDQRAVFVNQTELTLQDYLTLISVDVVSSLFILIAQADRSISIAEDIRWNTRTNDRDRYPQVVPN